MDHPTQESYMLSHEVAEVFGVTTQTLYNWLKKGKIPEPKRHPITKYRLWTPQDVQRIRQVVNEESNQ
jgi:DNA-binding transcriptional MerR regulator